MAELGSGGFELLLTLRINSATGPVTLISVYSLVRRAANKIVLHTRSYHSEDCDTDHSLVCCKIRMQPKKFHRTKTKGTPRIDNSKMSQPDLLGQFAQTFEKEVVALNPVTEKWETLGDTMYRTALATFGKRS